MKIWFYKNKSENNEANKDVELVTTLEGSERSDISADIPVFRVPYSEALSQVRYCFISVFDRYYYLDPPKYVGNGILEFTGHTDVLMSFQKDIRELEAIIRKQENEYNLLINDGSMKIQSDEIIYQKLFPKSLTGQTVVLAVTGHPGD